MVRYRASLGNFPHPILLLGKLYSNKITQPTTNCSLRIFVQSEAALRCPTSQHQLVFSFACCERQWCLSFGCARLVALWFVLWATHGLRLRALVYRGCPCRDPPMCLDVQGGIKAKRQPFCGCWSVVLSMSCGGLANKVNVISLQCLCTRFVSNNGS